METKWLTLFKINLTKWHRNASYITLSKTIKTEDEALYDSKSSLINRNEK